MTRKVLYLTDTGSIMGGGEISLLNLLENIDRSVFTPVACVPRQGDLSGKLEQMGIHVETFSYKRLFNPFNIVNTLRTVRRIMDIIVRENIGLVHTNSTGGIVLLAGFACARTGIPLVSHVRLVYSGFLQDICQGLLSSRIIVISGRIYRKLSFRLFRDKITQIYNGVNIARFREQAGSRDFRREFGIDRNALLIGASGTYVPGKGFEYFIDAVKELKPLFPGLRAVAVGFQPEGYADYIRGLEEKARQAGVGDIISFLPRYDAMPAFFKALDVFVFPSLIDPFGRVLIEAMASEKPVAAFRTGGAPEIVADGSTGFLVRPKDSKALAEKIGFMLRDRDFALKMGREGLKRCEQFFDIKVHAAAVEKVYREVFKDPSLGYIGCPICGVKEYSVINRCRIEKVDADIEESVLSLCRCRKCGLVFVNPQPRLLAEKAGELYKEDYFGKGYMRFYGDKSGGAVQSNEPFPFRLDLISKFRSSGRLLDIGCASGEFLVAARDRGFDVSGVDISDYAVSAAKQKYGLDVRKGSLAECAFESGSFDIITAGDVIEHIKDPLAFLNEANRLLRSGGVLYLAVPDFSGLHYRVMNLIVKFNHKNYFVLPHHVFHFTGATLEKLLVKAGFVKKYSVSTGSSIQEKGFRKIFMLALFCAARILRMQDRVIILAAKA